MLIGIIENNKMINIIVADSFEAAKDSIEINYPNSEQIDLTDNLNNIGVEWERIDGQWYPPERSDLI